MEKVLIHDISYHQGDLTKYWPLFREKGVQAIIIQATNGLAYQQYFHDTAKVVKAQGFYVGSYHYFRQQIRNVEGTWYTCDPLKQAQNYFNWVEKSGVRMDLPPALDVENGGNPYLSNATVEKTLSFIEKLFGRVPMLYSSPSTLDGFTKDSWTKYPLWLAHYTTEDKIKVPRPWKTWTLWQYSDKITYTPPGSTVRKPIDHNCFNGSLSDFRKFFNLQAGEGTTPPPAQPDPESVIQQADIDALKAKIAAAIDDWARTL